MVEAVTVADPKTMVPVPRDGTTVGAVSASNSLVGATAGEAFRPRSWETNRDVIAIDQDPLGKAGHRVVQQGELQRVLGLLAGSVIAVAAARIVGGMLVNVSASDPLTFASAAAWLPPEKLGGVNRNGCASRHTSAPPSMPTSPRSAPSPTSPCT